MNHVDKYYWVIDHPNIGYHRCQGTIELTPHMVNPENKTIEDDKSLNTSSEWWVEFSKYHSHQDRLKGLKTHYWQLDCGGETAEEAIDNLYNLVKQHYGDY